VRVQIRLNTTEFHSGKLLVCWCPHWNVANPAHLMTSSDIYAESQLDSIMVSANANETIGFEIPYVAPSTYFDLTQNSSVGQPLAGFFGTVNIYVLAPLRLTGSSGTPSVNITVYSNFVEPEVAGFTLVPIAKITGATSRKKKFFNKKYKRRKQ